MTARITRERSPVLRRRTNNSEASKHTSAPAKTVAIYRYCIMGNN